MAPPLPLPLKPQPQTLTRTLASIPSRRPFSSSSIDSDPVASETKEPATPSPPPPRSSYSSLFSDIKDHLKSPPSPPRRIPQNPSPPPPPPPAGSLDDIRKHLAEFRLRSPNPNPNPNNRSSSSPSPVPSFQQLFRDNAVKNDPNPSSGGGPLSFDSIRENLRKFRSSPNHPPNFRSQVSYKPTSSNPLVGDQEKLQDLIFGNETGKEKEGEAKTLNTEFVRIYSYDELGEKLRRLRPEAAEKGGKDWFSLEELNLRLAKLRELEETESAMGGVSFRVLRESLTKLKEGEKKHANMQKLSMLVNIGLPSTPSFMLKPPQEQLLENYFHPDHMSSAEKMKLELKKVRDEFKMSESDCGSARVQVAQLTTKIKHLSSVLHKKDKHSRKGLHDMVQRRKKLLKYLRRTDWDSYCFVLSKLGLRDVPEYKTPDYKS